MAQRAPPGAVAAAARQDGQGQQGGGMSSTIKQAILTMVAVQAVQYGVKYYMSGSLTSPATSPSAAAVPSSSEFAASAASSAVPANAKAATAAAVVPVLEPLWEQGTIFDAHMYITATGHPHINLDSPMFPHVKFEGLKFGDFTWKHEWDTEVSLPQSVQRNGSLFLETVLSRNGAPLDPRLPGYEIEDIFRTRTPLMYYSRVIRERKERNLLSGSAEQQNIVQETAEETKAKDAAMPIISYYHPNLTMTVVSNPSKMPSNSLTPPVARHIQTIPPVEGSVNPRYYPIVFPNAFWQLKGHAYPINETVPSVPLHIKFQPIGSTKFQIFATMDESFKQAAENPANGGAGVAEFDELKRILLETNIVLLSTTIIVTILHTLFEFLAFKNDVTHWRKQKDQVGVSLRTIIANVITQLIILLYLIESSEQTSFMILFGQGTGLLIEAWKITKAVDIKVVRSTSGLLPYKVEFRDKHVLSAEEKATQEYDALAFKWVIWATTPFLLGYAVYSLMYNTHRSWYSFVLTTLTSCVYMGGFIQLVPQLIINYKLKSVAHMPMRSLTYKALNTVVDDFFAFVIKMPLLARIASFRDDVVFVVLLYQMYIYRVDPNRANEYGQVLDEKIAHAEQSSEVKEEAKAGAVKETKKNK